MTLLSANWSSQCIRGRLWLQRLFFLFFTCIVFTSVVHAQPIADPRLTKLLLLMQQRLNLAQDVAMYKWNIQAEIDDPVREQQILAKLADQAPQYGLEPKLAQNFFAMQMVAGKMIQTALFKDWHNKQQAPFANPPDLKNKIRPELDQLTVSLLTALAAAQPVLQGTAGQQALELAVVDVAVQAGAQSGMPGYRAAWEYALTAFNRH